MYIYKSHCSEPVSKELKKFNLDFVIFSGECDFLLLSTRSQETDKVSMPDNSHVLVTIPCPKQEEAWGPSASTLLSLLPFWLPPQRLIWILEKFSRASNHQNKAFQGHNQLWACEQRSGPLICCWNWAASEIRTFWNIYLLVIYLGRLQRRGEVLGTVPKARESTGKTLLNLF